MSEVCVDNEQEMMEFSHKPNHTVIKGYFQLSSMLQSGGGTRGMKNQIPTKIYSNYRIITQKIAKYRTP